MAIKTQYLVAIEWWQKMDHDTNWFLAEVWDLFNVSYKLISSWLSFGGVPIFHGGSNPQIPIPRSSNFLSVWIMKKNILATNFETHECVILVQSMKIGTHENKTVHGK